MSFLTSDSRGWPVDLMILYLAEPVGPGKRKDVALAQLGRQGQLKLNQMVSFAGTWSLPTPSSDAWVARPATASLSIESRMAPRLSQ